MSAISHWLKPLAMKNKRSRIAVAVVNTKSRVVRRPQKQHSKLAGDDAQIPTVITNVVRGNRAQNKVISFKGKEIIGEIELGSFTAPGVLGEISLNPVLLGARRLEAAASNYSQYRFKKLITTIRGNVSTSVGGDIAVGYTRNPNYRVVSGPASVQDIYSMEQSMITNLWSKSDFECPVKTNQWYNVDGDSSEIMLTEQGKILMATNGVTNMVGTAVIPVIADYEVEFRGEQTQRLINEGVPIVFPAVDMVGPSDPNGSVRLTIATGETLDYPWNRGMVAWEPYFVEPAQTYSNAGLPQDFTIIMWDGNTEGYFRFYETLEAFNTDLALVVDAQSPAHEFNRFIIQQALQSSPPVVRQRGGVKTLGRSLNSKSYIPRATIRGVASTPSTKEMDKVIMEKVQRLEADLKHLTTNVTHVPLRTPTPNRLLSSTLLPTLSH